MTQRSANLVTRYGQCVATVCYTGMLLAGCSSAPVQPAASLKLTRNAIDSSAPVYGPPRQAPAHHPVGRSKGIPLGGGHIKIGKPYRVGDRWFHPKADTSYNRTGTASWYGKGFQGKKTANGETFDMNRLTAAHPTLPLPSYVKVTNLANNRTVIVRINDRGPYSKNRIIDMSRASARHLGFENNGTARVRVRWVGKAPLNGNEKLELAFLQRQPWYRRTLASQ